MDIFPSHKIFQQKAHFRLPFYPSFRRTMFASFTLLVRFYSEGENSNMVRTWYEPGR